jgi:XTP/dITP diphosphohydrolase
MTLASRPTGETTKQLVLATRNAAKLEELRRILAPLVAVEVIGLDDVPPYEEVPETGATFEENALIKAREAVLRTGLPAVADDSGLTVAALNGMPGVLSARWAGSAASDAANLRLVLEQIADVPDDRRAATFECAAVLVTPSGAEQVVRGTMSGTLLRAPRGSNGFGYDPIFVPDGDTRTTAEMTPAEKDAISHRGRAFRTLAPLIATTLT